MAPIKQQWLDHNLVGNPLEEELKGRYPTHYTENEPTTAALIWGLNELDAKDAVIARLVAALEAIYRCEKPRKNIFTGEVTQAYHIAKEALARVGRP